MKSKLLSLLLAFILASKSVISTIQVEPDGGYSGIVIKISEDVPEDECYNILQKVQVRIFFNLSVDAKKIPNIDQPLSRLKLIF